VIICLDACMFKCLYDYTELTKSVLYCDGAQLRIGAELRDSKLQLIKLSWYYMLIIAYFQKG
jgi:hypothetical protein